MLKIYEEARKRSYCYNKSKIVKAAEKVEPIKITKGQILYEFHILKERVKGRDPKKYKEVLELERKGRRPKSHPLFVVIEGEVEPWEKSYWKKRSASDGKIHKSIKQN